MRTKIAVALVAIGFLTGCSGGSEPETPEQLASLRVLTEPCETDVLTECGTALTIDQSGNWTLGEKTGKLEEGYFLGLKETTLSTTLDEAVDTQADCPLEHGGVETIYSWYADEEVHLVRSCEKEISPEDPLVKQLENLWVDLNG